MKQKLLVFLSLTLSVLFCFSLSVMNDYGNQASASEYKSRSIIVIDAGHGGKDAGTIGVDGTSEKTVNLEIAASLYDYLTVCGINSVLIRNGDYEIYKEGEGRERSDLYNRLDFINSIDNAVLISIHQNHFDDEAEWGTQIWYSANNSESEILANSILHNIKEQLQKDNKRENKVSDNSYYLLYQASVPSIMIECGFMSNKRENALLQDSEYQNDMAFLISSGISNIV
jgi:N-acetylmuramoyl-L-alanine amidase